MSRRVSDYAHLNDEQWRQLVNRDLDAHDIDISGLRSDLGDDIRAVRAEMGELKEQQKWILRTSWGVLVSLMLVLAAIVGNVVVP